MSPPCLWVCKSPNTRCCCIREVTTSGMPHRHRWMPRNSQTHPRFGWWCWMPLGARAARCCIGAPGCRACRGCLWTRRWSRFTPFERLTSRASAPLWRPPARLWRNCRATLCVTRPCCRPFRALSRNRRATPKPSRGRLLCDAVCFRPLRLRRHDQRPNVTA